MHAIGIDIGGTKIAGALVAETGEILRMEKRPTPAGDPVAIVDLVVELIRTLGDGEEVAAAGVAAAGFIAAGEEARQLREAAAGDFAELRLMVQRRLEGEPLPWITGATTFCGLEVAVDCRGALHGIPSAVDVVAYRAVQEGLTNALKHGSAGRAELVVARDDQTLRVTVTNPAAAADTAPSTGHGLIGIRERVASVRGRVRTVRVGGAYRLDVVLPLTPTARGAAW